MKNIIATVFAFMILGLMFSQTAKTDTVKTTTTQPKTKLIQKRMSSTPVQNITVVKQVPEKDNTQPSGTKEEENTKPK